MKDCSPSVAPIVNGDRLCLNLCLENNLERESLYAPMVGSLMYTQVSTRPKIAYVVRVLEQYQSNLSMDHWRATKKLMRYLQGTKYYMFYV